MSLENITNISNEFELSSFTDEVEKELHEELIATGKPLAEMSKADANLRIDSAILRVLKRKELPQGIKNAGELSGKVSFELEKRNTKDKHPELGIAA